MADTVIEVENLSKKYVIGHQRESAARYESLRDVMANGVRSFWRSLSGRQSDNFQPREEFWALKDVCEEIYNNKINYKKWFFWICGDKKDRWKLEFSCSKDLCLVITCFCITIEHF